MKFAIRLAVFLWFLSGVTGAWMIGELNAEHWRTVARGPMTLVKAINDNPVTVPSLH